MHNSSFPDAVDEMPAAPTPRWKRMLDISCILCASPVWLPIMVILALLVKIVSRGPVFFFQKRIGFNGRCFMMLKFRSMKMNASHDSHECYMKELIQSDRPMEKLDSADERLIPFGRIIRASGLDELPQLLNVLRGEMSLVGPRPCTPTEYEHFEEWQKERVQTLPGLTGNWQVSGKNTTTFKQMIQLDIEYTRHPSLKRDAEIILKTIPAIWTQIKAAKKAKSTPKPRDRHFIYADAALQLLAYHAAVAPGCDVDKPRNLTKSVTVE